MLVFMPNFDKSRLKQKKISNKKKVFNEKEKKMAIYTLQ